MNDFSKYQLTQSRPKFKGSIDHSVRIVSSLAGHAYNEHHLTNYRRYLICNEQFPQSLSNLHKLQKEYCYNKNPGETRILKFRHT